MQSRIFHEFIPPESPWGLRRKCASNQQDVPFYAKNLLVTIRKIDGDGKRKNSFGVLVQILLTSEDEYTERVCLVEKRGK